MDMRAVMMAVSAAMAVVSIAVTTTRGINVSKETKKVQKELEETYGVEIKL